jgi:hypothetical protein
MDIYRYKMGIRITFNDFTAFILEILRILNGFMDIYRYNMGIRRSFNVFTAFIMVIWRTFKSF